MKFGCAWLVILALIHPATAEVVYWPGTLWLARDAAVGIDCIGNLKQIALAARVWQSDHGQFPPGFDALTNSPINLCCPANEGQCEQDYEWLTGFEPNNEQSVFSQCRIHGNVARVNGAAERLFNFREGWPAVVASPMDVSATPGETVKFEVRLAPMTVQPVKYQWQAVEYVRTTNVLFVADPEETGGGYWRTNVSIEAHGTAIPNTDAPTYVISNVHSNDAAYYRVSLSNAMGTATSSPGRLRVASDVANPQTDAPSAEVLCISRLSSIALAARLRANDTQRLAASFAEMTLGWPLILYCPWDTNRVPVEEWADVSYELMLPTPDLEDAYAPYCRCKAHDFIVEAGGRVRSRVILRGPRVTTDGLFGMTVYGPASYAYVIECSADATTWTPVATNATSGMGFSEFQMEARPGRKFFRAKNF